MSARISLLLVLSALLLALFLFWLLTRSPDVAPIPLLSPTPNLAPTSQTTRTPPNPDSATATKTGYRLAGTVVGDALYAVIELPDGTNELYRPGQMVPGLGRLVDLGANRATFEGGDGRIELQLVPASTPTVTPSPEEKPMPAKTTQPAEPEESDRTPPGESPSSELDQSAS
jgi:hypothetical protein